MTTTTGTLDCRTCDQPRWHRADCGLCGQPLRWEWTGQGRATSARTLCGCPDGEGTTRADISPEFTARCADDGLVYATERSLDALVN